MMSGNQITACSRCIPRPLGNRSSTARVTGTAIKFQIDIQTLEPMDDGIRWQMRSTLAESHIWSETEWKPLWSSLCSRKDFQFSPIGFLFIVQQNAATTLVFGCNIFLSIDRRFCGTGPFHRYHMRYNLCLFSKPWQLLRYACGPHFLLSGKSKFLATFFEHRLARSGNFCTLGVVWKPLILGKKKSCFR